MKPTVFPIPTPAPAHTLTLTSDRLAVEIARPGTIYRGARFDWTGFITQVTLDDTHTFCTDEGDDPTSTGGVGLCSEFDLTHPISYDSAQPGETFFKIGVGLLTKLDDAPYRFARRYPIQSLPTQVEQIDHSEVLFSAAPLLTRGYGAQLSKRIRVTGDSLLVEYQLANVGRLPLSTREYNHNFLAFNGEPISEAYVLQGPDAMPPHACLVQQGGGTIQLKRPAKGSFYSHRRFDRHAPRAWRLEHRMSGLWLKEETSQPWSEFAVYGTATLVSPEAFLDLHIAPGDTARWWRRYQFGINR